MLWSCHYRALPGVRPGDLARRFLRQHDAGTNQPGRLRGWYAFGSGVSGVVLIEADTPKDVAAVVGPYQQLARCEVQACVEVNYNQTLEELRRTAQKTAMDDAMAGLPPAPVR
jgi:uncharacterized protein DUF3303